MESGSLTTSIPSKGKDATTGQCYVDVRGVYPITFKFIIITTPAFNLSYTRRAWQI